MSTNAKPISNEEQAMLVIRNLFNTEYGLDKDDRDLIFRLIKYGDEKVGLSVHERAVLRVKGMMDDDETFSIPEEFFFRGLVLPSFWMKCLMALYGMIDFSEAKVETR